MNVIQEIKDLKRRFNFLRRQYETYQEPTNGVKRYKATLTQTGTNAPIVTILENTFEGTITISYEDVGQYNINNTLPEFTSNEKTFLYIGTNTNAISYFYLWWNTTQEIQIYTDEIDLGAATETPTDELLSTTSILIEVYP